MATTNINEAGWFYHAPGKRQQHERADYPPASQIPGLGDYTVESDQPSPPHQMVFKDSDSKYIRLAKMGGRKDLLCMNPRLAEDKAREPVGYPRCDWFYLEDNAVENATLKQEMNWQFLLPDYMVHEEHQMDPAGFSGDKKRPPYGFDKMTAFQRDGEGLTDKTVKLPELQRPGFGVRNSKPIKVIMKQPTHSVKLRAPASQQAPVKPRSSG